MKRRCIAGILVGIMVLSHTSALFADEEILSEEIVFDAAEEEQFIDEDTAVIEEDIDHAVAEDILMQDEDTQSSDVSDAGLIEDTDADGEILKAADGTTDDDYDDSDDYDDYEVKWVVTTDLELTAEEGDPDVTTYTWYDLGEEYTGDQSEISGANGLTYTADPIWITHFYMCITIDEGVETRTYFQIYDREYFEREKNIPLNSSTNIRLNPLVVYGSTNQYMAYKLTPAVSGHYTFTSVDFYANEENSDPIAYLYGPDGKEICRQDDGGEGYNFQISRYLEAGKTYTLNLGYYDFDNPEEGSYNYGTYTVTVTYGSVLHEHEYTQIGEVNATCGHGGYNIHECTICGEIWNETTSSPTGNHVWGPWVETIPADTDHANTAISTCQVCGQTQTGSTVAALPISFSKYPTSLKAKAASKGKVTVSWSIKKAKKSKKEWKKIKKIELQYGTDPTFAVRKSKTYKKTSQKVTLKLAKNTTYYIRIRFIDGKGGYSKWVSKSVKTKKK